MKIKYLWMIVATLLIISCSEFNAVKSPSVTITSNDISADYCNITINAGKYACIKYTTDGDVPRLDSRVYEDTLSLPVGTVLRTAAFCPGGRRSQIISTKIDTSLVGTTLNESNYCE